jgi:adenylate cyclase
MIKDKDKDKEKDKDKDKDKENSRKSVAPMKVDMTEPWKVDGVFDEALILLVDDHKAFLEYMEMNLSKLFRIVTACDGNEGLKKANYSKPDLIITDLMMPGIDGLQMCLSIKSNPLLKNIPIILLSAKSDLEARVEGLERGADDYIPKGFEPRELVARIRALLRITRMEREIAVKNEQLAELNRSLEQKVKKQVEELSRVNELKRYLSPMVVDAVLKTDRNHLNNTRKQITIFFSDLRKFTAATEEMEPEEIVRLLNEYFSEMTQLVFSHGGTLDKFIGDGLMAFFGDPMPMTDHAKRAVQMALEMQEKMKELCEHWLDCGISPLKIGIGINTGIATVGNIGCEARMDYTAIGRHVNLAARLQNEAKGGEILISRATWGLIRDEYECESCDVIQLKGIGTPQHIYRVIAKKICFR